MYIDPYGANEFADSADIVLITHEHSDHNDLNCVHQKSGCRVIRSAQANIGGVYQSFTIGTISIKAVAAYNSNHPKNECVGYVVQFDGIKLYHAGDTGYITEMADLAAQKIDYALLPMDGIYTMSPEEATKAAADINARASMPIHTMPPPDTYSDPIVARFTPSTKLIVKPGATIALKALSSSVDHSSLSPSGFRLDQNYPNPFNPNTRIDFTLPATQPATLKIYDVCGKEVSTLLSEPLPAGRYSREWNAASFPSGVYFYTLHAGAYSETKKLILVK
jgi:hypothetical protein